MPEVQSFLKPTCPCGDDRCTATGKPGKATGHSRGCWEGCPTCARPTRKQTKRIPTEVRRQVAARKNGWCEAEVPGVCKGKGVHAHHVRRRAQGGLDSASNLLWVCGEDGCHGWIHSNPGAAVELGLLAETRPPEPISSAVPLVAPATPLYDQAREA